MDSIGPCILLMMKYHGLWIQKQHDVSKRSKLSLHHEHVLTDFKLPNSADDYTEIGSVQDRDKSVCSTLASEVRAITNPRIKLMKQLPTDTPSHVKALNKLERKPTRIKKRRYRIDIASRVKNDEIHTNSFRIDQKTKRVNHQKPYFMPKHDHALSTTSDGRGLICVLSSLLHNLQRINL